MQTAVCVSPPPPYNAYCSSEVFDQYTVPKVEREQCQSAGAGGVVVSISASRFVLFKSSQSSSRAECHHTPELCPNHPDHLRQSTASDRYTLS
ncbi:hypothetical protein NQZ68_019923 [Dissostichus eleginoides]|nr:hypothetical protein NQZ68_019923 [Dissostichus eleginoides]